MGRYPRILHGIRAHSVLSEGQNLQDAQYVINYDLHWNPVRIIQREGRIDRLRSPHKEIFIYNFFPEKGLDLFLKLMPRLSDRIDVIDETFALDGDVIYKGDAKQCREDLEKIQAGDLVKSQCVFRGVSIKIPVRIQRGIH